MPLCTAKKAALRRHVVSSLGPLVLAGSVLALAACADYWPDDASPDDWFASAAGEEAAPRSEEPVPGEDEDYPNLAEVPDAPVNISTPEQIDAVAEALAADLANAEYSGTLPRVDDETTPAAMPAPPPEVIVEEEDITVIAPGGEIEIAEAQALPAPPEPVEEVVVEEELVIAEPASPPAEADVGVVLDGEETLVVAPAPGAEPMEVAISEPVESRVETETVRDDSGELVGTVTRVVASREVAVVSSAAEEPAVVEEVTVAVEQPAVVEETIVVAPAAEVVAVEETVAVETMAVEETLTVTAGTPDDGSNSLVAQSERTTSDNVVVVPEYAAEAAIAEQEIVAAEVESEIEVVSEAEAELQAAVAAEARTMEPVPDEVVVETRVEDTTVVDGSGDPVGVVVTTSEETVVEVAATGQQVTGAAIVPAEQLDFDDLLAASGPAAGTAAEPVTLAEVPTASGGEVAFTSGGALAQTLAAIIRFGDGSSALGAAERDILRQLAAFHDERGGMIRLVGHASRTAGGMETSGQQLANFNISLDRATAVAEELIRLGVPRDDVIVEAAGDNAATALDAASDRRVDIYVGA